MTASTPAADGNNTVISEDDPRGVYDLTDLGHSGYGPFRYRILPEPHLTRELARMALARTHILSGASASGARDAYSVSFQPCCDPDAASQDRLAVDSWTIDGADWTFAAVFDGHGGHDTADHALSALPALLRAALSAQQRLDPRAISALLASTITAFDDRIAQDLLALFPGGVPQLASMSDAEIRALLDGDGDDGGAHAAHAAEVLARCMRGSTALVALVDPTREHLWVANLGDCVAVLGEVEALGSPGARTRTRTRTRSSVLHALHNGSNPAELARIHLEHPAEPECTLRKRVLGALAVTRALGDHAFKLPALYTERVFLHARAGFKTATPIEEVLPRIRTPPYVANVPDVRHVALARAFESAPAASASAGAEEPPPTPLRADEDEPGPQEVTETETGVGIGVSVVPPTPQIPSSNDDAAVSFDFENSDPDSQNGEGSSTDTDTDTDGPRPNLKPTEAQRQKFLILASDGLEYLYHDTVAAQRWAKVVGRAILRGENDENSNPALSLLRDGLGGKDAKRVSSMLNVELGERWMDDTTIVVLPL